MAQRTAPRGSAHPTAEGQPLGEAAIGRRSAVFHRLSATDTAAAHRPAPPSRPSRAQRRRAAPPHSPGDRGRGGGLRGPCCAAGQRRGVRVPAAGRLPLSPPVCPMSRPMGRVGPWAAAATLITFFFFSLPSFPFR